MPIPRLLRFKWIARRRTSCRQSKSYWIRHDKNVFYLHKARRINTLLRSNVVAVYIKINLYIYILKKYKCSAYEKRDKTVRYSLLAMIYMRLPKWPRRIRSLYPSEIRYNIEAKFNNTPPCQPHNRRNPAPSIICVAGNFILMSQNLRCGLKINWTIVLKGTLVRAWGWGKGLIFESTSVVLRFPLPVLYFQNL